MLTADRLEEALLDPGTCGRSGCSNPGRPCAYADAFGNHCQAGVCSTHGGELEGAFYCARHLLTALALATAGPLAARPGPDDRRHGLVLGVHAELSARVLDLLARAYPYRSDVQVAADPAPKLARRCDEVAWEQGWTCFAPTGNLLHATLRVGDGEPPVVSLLVGPTTRMALTPYWIARRRSGAAPDGRDRVFFAAHLLDSLAGALSEAPAQPGWLAS